jgi:large conductance mechanosensitive channel
MKKLFAEFKEFVMQGDVVDLAIGIVIGSAFSVIVNSFVDNLLMPPLGLLFGDVNFSDLFIILKQGAQTISSDATLQMAKDAGAVTFNYGQFVTDLISFLFLAFGIFFIVKGINSLKKQMERTDESEAEAPSDKECPYCCNTIPLGASRCPFCTSSLE